MRELSKARGSQLKWVFLDRDGVINEKMPEGLYVRSTNEFRLLPGVAEAIAKLNRAGLKILVVSNQRGIALQLYTLEDVAEIHASLQRDLAPFGARIDAFYICPHDRGACSCRKPLSGMFEQAQRQFAGLDGGSSIMIGDSLCDVEFGRRLGMRTVLIERNGTAERPEDQLAAQIADEACASLKEAADRILARFSESAE